MAKKILSPSELMDLRFALQIAAVDAMMQSRRWEPGELAFQGGTCLHLAHQSPRFSEDLDFLISSSLDVKKIVKSCQARLKNLRWLPAESSLDVTKIREANPHSFTLSIRGDNLVGSAQVKVELWRCAGEVIEDLAVQIRPVRAVSGPLSGAQSFVPCLGAEEIYADKVFALVARPYLKARDVFDLHWLQQTSGPLQVSPEQMRNRLTMYQGEPIKDWLRKAPGRDEALAQNVDLVKKDLKRWLPSSWPLNDETAKEMIVTSRASLKQGFDVMQAIDASGWQPGDNGDGERASIGNTPTP